MCFFFHISQVIIFSTTTPAAKVNSADKQKRTWIFFSLHGTIASYLLWKQTRWPPFVPACHARLAFDESDTSVFVLPSLSFPSTSFSLVWNKMNNIRGALVVKKVPVLLSLRCQSHGLWSRIMKIRIESDITTAAFQKKQQKNSFLADSKFKFGFEASWLVRLFYLSYGFNVHLVFYKHRSKSRQRFVCSMVTNPAAVWMMRIASIIPFQHSRTDWLTHSHYCLHCRVNEETISWI